MHIYIYIHICIYIHAFLCVCIDIPDTHHSTASRACPAPVSELRLHVAKSAVKGAKGAVNDGQAAVTG